MKLEYVITEQESGPSAAGRRLRAGYSRGKAHTYGNSTTQRGFGQLYPAGGQGHLGPGRHCGVAVAQRRLGHARPGIPDHGAVRVEDHVHRREQFDPAVPRVSDRAAVRAVGFPGGRVAAGEGGAAEP